VSKGTEPFGVTTLAILLVLVLAKPCKIEDEDENDDEDEPRRVFHALSERRAAFLFKSWLLEFRGLALEAAPNSSRKLFITTITVLPSWPTTPTGKGIFPSIANTTSTATVPSEMTRFCRMMRRARAGFVFRLLLVLVLVVGNP